MNEPVDKFRGLTRSVSAGLSTLRASTPEVMKSFSELGKAATSAGTLDAKTKELIALALSVASLRISRHRGHPFHGIADSVSRQVGHRFTLIADSVSA